jgi:4'-phosphopantetheinyl transferase
LGKPSSVSERAPAIGEVHLWLCQRGDAAALDTAVLSRDEQARARRWRGAGEAEFALGRALLRHLLSRYAPQAPAEWQFATGPHGKPELAGTQSDLQFNLSHSGDWLALALSRQTAVGVDVQIIDRDRSVGRLARRYFPAEEVAELEALQGDAFTVRFYELWALKEALTKARGASLPGTLGATALSLQGGKLKSLTPGKTRGVSLALLNLPGYALAVCGLETGLTLQFWRWSAGCGESTLELARSASLGFS